jgi:hypothetical protein
MARWSETRAQWSAAEARCARLQQALQHVAEAEIPDSGIRSSWSGFCKYLKDCAREVLAGLDTPADSPEPREGIVMVYDWQHRYLGCMGIERWQEVLAADSQDCEHDYVYVSRSEDYYRCDKCDQTSKDGVYPRVGNFHPFKPADSQPEEPT